MTQEKYRCRACGTIWTQEQVMDSPTVFVKTCSDVFCGGTCDQVKNKVKIMQKIQTTYTFVTQQNAVKFISWLKQMENDRDFGYPKYIDCRSVGLSTGKYLTLTPAQRQQATLNGKLINEEWCRIFLQ